MKKLFLLQAFVFCAILLHAVHPTSFKFNGEQGVFTKNFGQVVDAEGKPVIDVLAKGSIPGLDIYITKTGITYVLLKYEEDLSAAPHPVFADRKSYKVKLSRVDVELTGATLQRDQLQGANETDWKSTYYKSPDGKGQEGVSHYQTLTIQNVYPGIDWVWHLKDDNNAEYDFVVHPGADPSAIKMKYSYGDLTAENNQLIIGTHTGSLTEGPLTANCQKQPVPVTYQLNSTTHEISFKTGKYDTSKDFTIDPPLSLNWSAQFGGSFTNGMNGVATNKNGDIFLVGFTTSNNFPFVNAHGGNYIDSTYNGASDAVILKLDSAEHLKWATYMGGPGNDFANSVSTDTLLGRIYITGGAAAGFPYTYGGANHGGQDAFIAVFNSNLSLYYAQFYGGNATDEGLKIYNNFSSNYNGGHLYVTGYTNSTNGTFPIAGYSNFYSNSVTGDEAFILAFNAGGYPPYYVNYATTYGGSGNDYATSVTTDSAGNAVVCGYTTSTNIQIRQSATGYFQGSNAGGTDGFILHFDPYNNLLGSSYYGGRGNDYFNDVTTGINGNFEFTGRTGSANFPLLAIGGYGYNQAHISDSTGYDAFIVKTLNDMTLNWATYFGGSGIDAGTGIATDAQGQMYVTGFTFSNNFPTVVFAGGYNQGGNHGNSDGFLARFTDLGILNWSTYKGDSCFEYPNSISYCRFTQQFYVAGQGLLACGQSFPDTGQIQGGVSSIGFCWGFAGQNNPPQCSFLLNVNQAKQPCPGACNGIAQVTTSGGQPPFNIIWSSGGTAHLDSNLCVGDSWVEAKDSLGCKAEATLHWYPLKLTLSATGITCLPGPATVTAAPRFGNGPYQFQWSTSPGVHSDSAAILVSDTGQYAVTVTDISGCSLSASALVGFNNVYPQGNIEVVNYPTCGNNSDGLFIFDFPGTDSIFPYGNITWTDANLNTIGTGDTLYNTNPLTTYYAIDSAYCYNGVTSPVTYSFNLDQDVTDASLSGNAPSTCVSYDGSSQVVFSPPTISVAGNNSGYYIENGTVDAYPGVSYLWSDGEMTQSIFGFGLGTYAVTVTDGSCQQVFTFTNTLPGPQVLPVIDSAYCNGGSIDLSNTFGGAGGAPYSYQWSTGNTGPVLNNLQAGDYFITISDAYGCADTILATIVQGTPLEINVSSVPAACNGGQGTVNVTGGAGLPAYIGIGSFSSSAGNYTYSITDDAGCSASANVQVTEPTAITVTAQVITPAGCSGGNASVSVTASGGTAPYTGDGTIQIPGGSQTIQVTDANGCTGSTIIQIPVINSNPIIPSNSFAPILCHGGQTTLTISATGGTGTITGTGNYTALAGNYTFALTDSLGCSVIDFVNISQPTKLLALDSFAPIRCFGDTTTLFIYGSGGTGPYIGAREFSANAGNYINAITDNNGCTANDTITITQPALLVEHLTTTPITCFGANSNIVISATGGTSPYTGTGSLFKPAGSYGFAIQDAHGCLAHDSAYITQPSPLILNDSVTEVPCSNSATIIITAHGGTSPYNGTGTFNRPTGNYGFVVIDSNGCSASDSVNIHIAPGLAMQINALPIACYGDSSSVTIIATGGTTPYTGTGIFTLAAGNFILTVSDSEGCSVSQNTLITQPALLTISEQITGPLCNGNNATILITASGGTSPYAGTGSLFEPAGNYGITVTDAHGCSATDSVHITQPPALLATDSIRSLPCNSNAEIIVSATGGTQPYSGTGQFYRANGTYNLVVTDRNGCSTSVSAVVNQLPTLSLHTNLTPVRCFGDSATITVSAVGGFAPFTGLGTFVRPAGNYAFTVTDSAGCSVTDSLAITQPAMLTLHDSAGVIRCYGATAPVYVSAHGGTPPYIGTGTLAQPAGNHNITVIDAHGCQSSTQINLTQPTQLNISITVLDTARCKDSLSIDVTASGGTSPYTGIGDVTYHQNGNYTLAVTDMNGCPADTILAVRLDTCTGIETINDIFGMSVYPNPANDRFYVKFTAPLKAETDIRLYAVDGKLVMTHTIAAGSDLGEMDCRLLASGVYLLRALTNGAEHHFKVVIDR